MKKKHKVKAERGCLHSSLPQKAESARDRAAGDVATFDSHASDIGQYTLNEEQKKIFNDACQDIARQIGSFHYA